MTSIAAALPTGAFASHVTVGERLSRLVFGSPSFSYAWRDMRLRRIANKRQRTQRAAAREIPVFTIDRKNWKGTERLPRIWLSEPNYDSETATVRGRTFIEAYPHDPDPQGWHAYGLARKYFSEGLSYAPASVLTSREEEDAAEAYRVRRLRRECFRAAEILYLHALRAGNVAAKSGLATLYRYDMCEGAYWSGLLEKRARHRKTIDPQKRAYALFAQLAARGDAEAFFQLGEMTADGCGCEADVHRAFGLFRKAFDRASTDGDDELAGKAALRIADAHAEGRGTAHSFVEAQTWYAVAVEHLQSAFDAGEWHCKRQLVEARLGAARMAQELSGQY